MNCTAWRSASGVPKVERLVTRAVAMSSARCAFAMLCMPWRSRPCEPMLAHRKTVAFATKQIIRGHFQVPDLDLRMASMNLIGIGTFDCHVLDVALDVVAGVGQLDDERRVLLMAWCVRISP